MINEIIAANGIPGAIAMLGALIMVASLIWEGIQRVR